MLSIIHKRRKFKFKKVHYFDLVVFAVILLILAIFLYNRFTRKSVWIDARIMVSDNDLWWNGALPPYWYVDALRPGQTSQNSFGEEVAKITNVEIFSLGGPYKQAYVDLNLKVSYDKNRQIYLYNFQPIQKGKPMDLTFGSNNISGLIVSLDSEPEEKYQKKIKIRMKNIEAWISSAYKAGMEMQDSNGNLLARIDNIRIVNSDLDRVKFLEGGIYLDRGEYRDVDMDITLVGLKDPEGYYRFVDGASIKIGESIWFHFPEIVVSGKIMEIIE